jgi:flagellar FliJ protein
MEEQARMDFAAARMHLDEEEEKLQILNDRKAAYENKGRELRKDSLKVREILENREAITCMEEFIAFQMHQVELAEAHLEDARYKLQVARQESKTQEKLKEKAFDVFMREENAREAKEVDELTSYTHGRK